VSYSHSFAFNSINLPGCWIGFAMFFDHIIGLLKWQHALGVGIGMEMPKRLGAGGYLALRSSNTGPE
jgi:hypothetical protein